MYAIFNSDDRMTGYAKVPLSTGDENRTVVETSEEELKGLMPDSFEGSWQDNRRKFTLDSEGNIVFEEAYQPENVVE